MNIKKQVRFLYRYLTTTNRWRSLINTQVLIVLVASAIFFFALAWSTPRTAEGVGIRLASISATQALTLNPSTGPTKTPFPPDYLSNSQQTIGITFAGAILVLIVVVGVIMFMPKKAEK